MTLLERLEAVMSAADREFAEGYHDGRDPDAPEPSANRSHAYRHSFAVGRAEIAGKPIPAEKSRLAAAVAEAKDRALLADRASPERAEG